MRQRTTRGTGARILTIGSATNFHRSANGHGNYHEEFDGAGGRWRGKLAVKAIVYLEQQMGVDPSPTADVFISYSHDRDIWELRGMDPETQTKRVSELATKLHSGGVVCCIDQHLASPPEGWPRWMMNQVECARYVVVVCTETYNRRFRGHEEPTRGHGAQWEGAVITQELYDANGKNLKFIPIVFDPSDRAFVPIPLRSATCYDMSSEKGYDDLYYRLTDQPAYVPTAPGPIHRRPPTAGDPPHPP